MDLIFKADPVLMLSTLWLILAALFIPFNLWKIKTGQDNWMDWAGLSMWILVVTFNINTVLSKLS